jgi:formate-dependent nitrite reductase membrane component NrfD
MAAVMNPFTSGRWVMESKPQTVWGGSHASWFFAMGVGGALFINRALFGMEMGRLCFTGGGLELCEKGLILADVLSMVFIGIGGLILIADLGKPMRVLRALLNPRTSWISVGAICDFIFLVLAGLWIIPDLEVAGGRPLAWLPWAGNSPLGIAFQVVAGAAAFIVIVYPGLVLACSPSIPFWNTALIPLQYLAFAFASAVGLTLVSVFWAPVPSETLVIWGSAEAMLLVVTLILFVAHLLNGATSHVSAKVSVDRLIKGELRSSFLWGVLLGGLSLPMLLILYGSLWSSSSPDLILLSVAGAITLLGNWFSKYTVIKAGAYAPFL